MDFIFQAIILGIVEGITEFLPISSTGHLIVTEHLLGFRDQSNTFTVVIQIGAILAVILFYWRDLLSRVVALFSGKAGAWQFWLNLVIATIPGAVLGLLLEETLSALDTPLTVAVALIVGGVLLYWLEMTRGKHTPVEADTTPNIDSITPLQALWIGFAQSVAIFFPGTSRSGAAMVGGWLVGLNRVTAVAFSFYLGIPTLGAAGLYKLYKARDSLSELPGGAPALLVGSLVSLVTAFLAVSWLLRYVSRNNFIGFAIYRIVAGAVILLLLATGIMPNT